MPTEPDLLPAGFHLGRHVARPQLGQGPMGKVYEAHDTGLNARVAIYVLDVASRTDQGVSEFLGWVRKARLGQPDLAAPCEGAALPVVDVGPFGDIHFAVMTSSESDVAHRDARRGRPTRG